MAGEVYQGGWHDGEAIESVYAGGQWHDNPYIEVYQGGAWHVLRTGVTAPTEVPTGLLALTGFPTGSGNVNATWTNTSSEWDIRIEWWKDEVTDFIVASLLLAPNDTNDVLTGTSGERYYFRVRYENAGGVGPWSAFSSSAVAA